MSNLFYTNNAPLAERMRPERLDDILGQSHILSPEGYIAQAINNKQISSLILWGPPGTGKTTLAQIIAKSLDKQFYTLSAIQSGVKDIRQVIQNAERIGNAILFIDEIHRFNKSQQDALLGAVEKGTLTLIGATTENPSFEVNAALLSRTQVLPLKSLTKTDLISLANRAISEDSILGKRDINLEEMDALMRLSGGDARKLLNLLEMSVLSFAEDEVVTVNNALIESIASQKMPLYDKKGEQHYDIISAFIKSIRGSDPQATVYWLARMLEAGEDIKFIARRMIISAAEDIGLANPSALILANNTFEAVNKIGMPEARIILSECAIFLANSPKSNSAYLAIDRAMEEVRKSGDLQVPLHLRNAPTSLMKEIGYGENYKYPHDGENNFLHQEYLPEEISDKKFYKAADNAREAENKKFLDQRWGENKKS